MIPDILTPDTPCSVVTTPLPHGGVVATVFIPTYSGGMTLEITAQRDEEGDDWTVFIPWPDGPPSDDTFTVGDNTASGANGILYIGSPDVDRPRTGA